MSNLIDLLSDDPPPELGDSLHSHGSGQYGRTLHPMTGSQTLQPQGSHASAHSSTTPSPAPSSPASSGFLNYPFSRVAHSFTRRLTDPDSPLAWSFTSASGGHETEPPSSQTSGSLHHSQHHSQYQRPDHSTGTKPAHSNPSVPNKSSILSNFTPSLPGDQNAVFQPPVQRTASPFSPPPLAGLTLTDVERVRAPILNRTLAEEIRLLLPARLQLADKWSLAFSVDQDGVSLQSLYAKCEEREERAKGREGFVLVVRDGTGGVFGAYLTDPPHPAPSYYGTGECFLWRASVLSTALILQSLPPPPSADTSTYTQRHVTLASPTSPAFSNGSGPRSPASARNGSFSPTKGRKNTLQAESGTSTPEQIRFKAFPYSGINDYLMYCEHDYLSVGGGDGRYGLWLDSSLERGVSSQCMTFGNEGLSDEGEKFEVLAVEVWCVGG